MSPQQSKMARAGLDWSIDDLAREAGVGRATVVRFEGGRSVDDVTLQKIKLAYAKRRVRIIEDGPFKGAVYIGLRPTAATKK